MAPRSANIVFDILAKDNASKVFDAMSDKLSKQEKALNGLRVAGTAQFVALTAAAGIFAKKSIDSARDLGETVNMATVIFGDQADEMVAWADTAYKTAGLSKQAALQATASFGDMFTQLGFASDASADMSRSTVQLAADLGSFRDLPTEDVLQRISAATRGEYDSLRLLVPNISAARVQQEAMTASGKKSADQLTQQEKVTATLAIITKDTTSAAGDFARTSGSLANQQKSLAGETDNLAAIYGQKLLPAAQKVTGAALEAFKWAGEHETAATALAITIGTLSTTIAVAANWQKIHTTATTIAAGAEWLYNTAVVRSTTVKAADAAASVTSAAAINTLTASTAAATAATTANSAATRAHATEMRPMMKGGLIVGGVLAGLGALDMALEALPSSARKSSLSLAETTAALLEMAKTGGDLKTAFDFSDDVFGLTGEVDSLAAAAKRISDPSLMDRMQDFSGSVRGVFGGGDTSRTRSIDQIGTLGQALASLVQSGNADKAAEQFQMLSDEWVRGGGSVEDLRALMPSYTDALADVKNQAALAADSTDDLTAAQQEQADALAAEQKAQEDATAALAKWQEAVQSSDASFIALQDAYDGVIDKNTEFAQSTADATKTADDSWETYYDGVTVSAADYIAQLQTQVDAQNNWETNMLAVADRVNHGMSGSMRDAGVEMVAELNKLGPAGAAQVDLLRTMSDEEFTKVVTLYQEKGTASITAFSDQLAATLPTITPSVNLGPVNQAMNTWVSTLKGIGVTATPHFAKGAGGSGGLTFAGGGPVRGPGTSTSDSIATMLSDGEFVETAAAHKYWGTDALYAINNMDPAAFFAAVSAKGFASGGAASPSVFASRSVTRPYVGLAASGVAPATPDMYHLTFVDADGALISTMRGVATEQSRSVATARTASTRRP